MTKAIWILRDTYEPKEGPYWSGHIRELARAAKEENFPIIEACVDDSIRPKPTDVLLYRPTQHGKTRRSFVKKVQSIQAFSINKNSSYRGTKQAFHDLAITNNIPTPKTWNGHQFMKQSVSNPDGFVVKPSRGSQGQNIVFCRTRKQVLREIRRQNQPTVVQEFVSLSTIEDIRLIMVGETLCGSMKRVLNSDQKGEFRVNLSIGKSHPVAYTPTEEMIRYAKKIMRLTKLDFAGIDVVLHKNKPLFLECNTRPGLKGIVNVDTQIPSRVLLNLCKRAQKI